jgi:hypothetical protein
MTILYLLISKEFSHHYGRLELPLICGDQKSKTWNLVRGVDPVLFAIIARGWLKQKQEAQPRFIPF